VVGCRISKRKYGLETELAPLGIKTFRSRREDNIKMCIVIVGYREVANSYIFLLRHFISKFYEYELCNREGYDFRLCVNKIAKENRHHI